MKIRILLSGAKNPFRWSILAAIVLLAGIQYFGCGGTASTSTVRQQAPKEKPKDEQAVQNPQPEEGQMTDEERQREVLVQYNLGWPHYRAKEYELAIPHFWNVINYDNENKYPGIYRQLADAYVELQKPDSALLVYEMGAQKDPNNIFIHQRLQWLHRIRGELDKAISETEEILRLDEGNEEYLKQLVDLLIRTDRLSDAVTVYDRLLVKNPGNEQYISEKMNLISRMGDSGELMTQYENLHRKDPKNKEYMDILIEQYRRSNESEKVIAMANKLLELDPNNETVLLKKADALSDLLRFGERISVLQRVIEINPKSNKALVDIADSYTIQNQFATAINYARRALNVDPKYGEAWMRIGEAYQIAADRVVNERGGFAKITFNDKLVYQKAFEAYQRASSFPEVTTRAKRNMEALQSVIPSKEDHFMHPDQKEPKDEAYNWM